MLLIVLTSAYATEGNLAGVVAGIWFFIVIGAQKD